MSGTLVLVAGAVVSARLPSPDFADMMRASSVSATPAQAATSAPSRVAGPASPSSVEPPVPAASTVSAAPKVPLAVQRLARIAKEAQQQTRPVVAYTVQPGDTLSGIAQWFSSHGYPAIYAANQRTIGPNPAQIVPGQIIVIRNGAMTVQRPT